MKPALETLDSSLATPWDPRSSCFPVDSSSPSLLRPNSVAGARLIGCAVTGYPYGPDPKVDSIFICEHYYMS